MQQKCTMFPERLTELRERYNLSRQQLADILGVSRASLEYYEKGKRTPDIEVLYKLSDYFNVTSDYLIGRTDKIGENTDVNAICKYTGLSEKSIIVLNKINNSSEYCKEYHKIINFLIEELNFVEYDTYIQLEYSDTLIEKLYNYFFCDFYKGNEKDKHIYISSLGHIFTPKDDIENVKKQLDDESIPNKDVTEIKFFQLPKNEVLNSVYINGIMKQLELSKQRFKGEHNGND